MSRRKPELLVLFHLGCYTNMKHEAGTCCQSTEVWQESQVHVKRFTVSQVRFLLTGRHASVFKRQAASVIYCDTGDSTGRTNKNRCKLTSNQTQSYIRLLGLMVKRWKPQRPENYRGGTEASQISDLTPRIYTLNQNNEFPWFTTSISSTITNYWIVSTILWFENTNC